MIPLKDQEAIQQKFAGELVNQVKLDYFTERNLGLSVPGKAPCQGCKPTREMLQELAGLSDQISLRVHYLEDNPEEKSKYGVERVPGTVMRGAGGRFVKFYGLPGGTEFAAFLESIVDLSRGEILLAEESVASLQQLTVDVSIRVFVTPTCPYCPNMMRIAYQMALVSPHVKAETIEINEFPELAEKYKVQAVPLTVINDSVAIPGMVEEAEIVKQLLAAVGPAGTQPQEEKPPDRIERGKERSSGLYIP